MKISKFFLFLTILKAGFASAVLDVDFNHSSGLDLMVQYSAKYGESDAQTKLNLLKKNYENLLPSKVKKSQTVIIPKIIHQIWLGPDEMPANFKYFQQTWKFFHPNWEFKVWNEDSILKENFDNIDLYWMARSYQERSDIIRYEILKKYGGLYIDTDIECYANFDEFHYKYDFYTNFEPPAINKKRVSILNAMIASTPNHPILVNTLVQVRKNWIKIEELFDSVYSNNKSSFARSSHNLAVQRTMHSFGDSVIKYLEKVDQSKNKSIVLPSGYNVPVYFVNDVPIVNFLSRIFRDKAKLSNQIKKRPETMSIHFHDKENSLMVDDYFANSIFGHSELKGVFYMLFNLRDKYYLNFRKLFQTNFPTLIKYRTSPSIPRVIYIYNNSPDIKSIQENWKKLNPLFDIKVLEEEKLLSFLPDKSNYLSKQTRLNLARFYLIKNNGGVFVDSRFIPADLLEFNQKYGYYGKIDHLNRLSEKVFLDMNIIAASKNHSFLRNMILNIEEKIDQKRELQELAVKKLYRDFVYRYSNLDGNSIAFPEMYFNQKR